MKQGALFSGTRRTSIGFDKHEAGSPSRGPAFSAGKYYLCKVIVRRRGVGGPGGGNGTFALTEGRVFAPSLECACGIVRAEIGLDFKPEDFKFRLSEVPPIAFMQTFQRPSSLVEWEEFKEGTDHASH